ncbi:protein RNA-directed DNA methylation 3 isoform X3 [Ananas comosus]|uniref:Protein RNA-directed DNA methylation 3 isoform X3 n=1 Tax=Ananas comosus TaxID=4615 RepID=A0A6P5FE69_ANACO|nr:protein RNA-directed DNA methylation 3 isoform X3 [Ananas comosus]
MAVKGKGKQVASSPSSASAKRKNPAAEAAQGSGGAASSRGRAKRGRPGVLQFFDDAAMDADDDELESGGEDAEEDFPDECKAENEDLKGTARPPHLPFFVKEEELSGDELEELIKDRYGRSSKYVVHAEDSKESGDEVSAADLMKDPTVWKIKCMIGRERQMAFCFMQKFVDLDCLGNKLQIVSAFALDHVKGFVFVEADKANDVSEACKGFCNIYPGRINLVPPSEVSHLLSSRNKSCGISQGSWVRMKSGKYKGDLAQVVNLDDGRKRVMIKLIPRIDLQAISKKFGGGLSLKHAAVPAPRLISSHELDEFRPLIETRRDRQSGEVFEVLDGMMLKDGYMYKWVSNGSVVFWGVQPSESELLKFSNVNKDDSEDLDWVSSVYSGRKKVRLTDDSDNVATTSRKNEYKLHDLVLFGQKDFGVIVTVEKDGVRILKGGTEGSAVVTLRKQDIKSGCVDKMFTALDRHSKTISVNDIVKVLEGSLEGRQGIVKHLYRGSIFIYDENETENSGFFCAKSESCEKIKKSRESVNSFDDNLGDGSASLFSEPPTISFENQDSSSGAGRRRQYDRDSLFSIGQTLRICKGPLKGYLCRVVRIFRSEVTVKLDSLVKIITVDAKFLSVPTRKRDDSTGAASDLFGTQEMPSIGPFSADGTESQPGRSSWDSPLPSFGSDGWQPFSASKLSAAGNTDNKTDDVDPWGSKVKSDQSADTWANAAAPSGDQNSSWDKSTTNAASGQADTWQNNSNDWSNKGSQKSTSDAGGWEKEKTLASDSGGSWGTGNKISNLDNSKTGGDNAWDKASNDKDKGKGSSWNEPNNWTKSEAVTSKTDSWDVKGKAIAMDDGDTWGKAKGKGIVINEDDSWDKAKGKGIVIKEDDSWGKATGKGIVINDDDTWGKAKGKGIEMNEDDPWGRAATNQSKSGNESQNWGSSQSQEKDGAFKGNQSGGWDAAAKSTQSSAAGGNTSSWDKAAKEKTETESGNWNKAGVSNQNPNDNWYKPKSFGGDSMSNWNKGEDKADRDNQTDSWNKPKSFDGGDWAKSDKQGGWNKPSGNYGNNGAGGEKHEERNWNRKGDFDGSKGSSWNRGGRYGGRGRGCDNNEFGDSRDNSVDYRPFGRGGGRGGGFGRGRGRGDSSDCRNERQSSGEGTYSKAPSSWASDQGAGWDKSSSFRRNEKPTDNFIQDKDAANEAGKSWGAKSLSEPKKDDTDTNWTSSDSKWNLGQSKRSEDGGGDKWNASKSSSWDKFSSENKSADASVPTSGWNSSNSLQDKQSSGFSGKTFAAEDAGAGQECEADPWASKVTSKAGNDSFDAGWNKASTKSGTNFDLLEKTKHASSDPAANDKSDAWNAKGRKSTLGSEEEDAWGKASKPQENITTETNVGNSSTWNKEQDTSLNSGSKWESAASQRSQSESQWNNWEKTKDKGATPTDSWSKCSSFDGGNESTWDKPRNSEGRGFGGFGGGRGRGRYSGEGGYRSRDNDWNKPADRGNDHRSSWNRDENNGSSNWNQRRDSDSGRGTSGERGRGRYGANRGRNQDNSWRGGRNQDNSWRGGRGNFGDRTSQNSQGSSWGKSDAVNSSDQQGNNDWSRGKPAAGESASAWGKQSSNWGKDDTEIKGNNAPSSWNNNTEEKNSWNTGRASGVESSGWEKNSTGSGRASGDQSAGWEKSSPGNVGAMSGGGSREKPKEAEGGGADQGSCWDKAAGAWGGAKGGSSSKGGW